MKKVMFILLSLVLLASSGMAATLYVAVTGNDTNNGSTWLLAKRSIQGAVNTAAVSGDVILVSNGTYTAAATDDQVVSIKKSVDIRSVNGPGVTIIDGQNSRRCVSVTPTVSGNPIYLSGFTIRNGNATSGAGVYREYYRDFYLSNCVIHANNSSRYGGGIHKLGSFSQMFVTDCIISNNQAGEYGAGVSSTHAGHLFMYNCQIVNNESTLGGGGVYGNSEGGRTGTIFELHGCRIANNSCAGGAGGGIYFSGTNGSISVVNNCIVERNSCSSVGAGIYHCGGSYLGKLFLTNCVIRGNETTYSSGYAGAGAKIGGPCRMIGCLIAGNKAMASGGHGGGLALESGTNVVEIDNITIVSNSATDPLGGGLAVHAAVTACTIRNTIIYNNSSTVTGRSNVFVSAGSGVIFTNCCTAPLTCGTDEPITPNADNINLNPVFVNLTGGNYRLKNNSPCINTGANMPWMAGAVDLDERSRIDRFSGKVDMGCYEHLPNGIVVLLP